MLLKKLRQSQIQKESTLQKVKTPEEEIYILNIKFCYLIDATVMGIVLFEVL